MTDTNKSIRSVSKSFVVPAGTQVVLKKSKTTFDQTYRKPGHVGVIVKCPAHNEEPYTLQFSDGSTALALFDEFEMRRREIDILLANKEFDHKPFIIYRCRVGSHAFGLANEDSDDDLRGIYLPPADLHWSLYPLPDQVESIESGIDEVDWEIEKFVRLALKANPNILETLWTDTVLFSTPISDRLREIRNAFLSKHVYKTYSGYVLSQFRRMKNKHDSSGKFKNKHAMHLIRLLYSGIEAVRRGEIMINVEEHREELLAIRHGEWSFEEIREKAFALDRQFQVEYESTKLPEQPDIDTVNQFLIDARREMI